MPACALPSRSVGEVIDVAYANRAHVGQAVVERAGEHHPRAIRKCVVDPRLTGRAAEEEIGVANFLLHI